MAEEGSPQAGGGEGWMLFQTQQGLGPWFRRSAAGQTMLLGTAFAALLVVTTATAAGTLLPASLADALRVPLASASVVCFVPLVALTLLHERRRLERVSLDPTSLTLVSKREVRKVPLRDIAEVRSAAEPTFGRVGGKGRFRELPSFVAVLRIRLADGTRFELPAARSEDVEGVVAWLDVLGEGHRIARRPSKLAASHSAETWLRRGLALLGAAVGGATASVLIQAIQHVRPDLLPVSTLFASVGILAIASGLYLASYGAQVLASDAWLEARGLGAAPPIADGEGSGPAAEPAEEAASLRG